MDSVMCWVMGRLPIRGINRSWMRLFYWGLRWAGILDRDAGDHATSLNKQRGKRWDVGSWMRNDGSKMLCYCIYALSDV